MSKPMLFDFREVIPFQKGNLSAAELATHHMAIKTARLMGETATGGIDWRPLLTESMARDLATVERLGTLDYFKNHVNRLAREYAIVDSVQHEVIIKWPKETR